MLSEALPIQPAQAYELSAQVKALIGEGQYKIALGWLDSERRHLGWANGWTGLLVRGGWELHKVRLLAPADAAYAQLNVGITGGSQALITGLSLRQTAARPEELVKLAIDIMPEQPSLVPSGNWRVLVRLENRGIAPLEGLSAELGLPAGVLSDERLTFDCARLRYAESLERVFTVYGAPQADSDFVLSVKATAAGQPVSFEQREPAFITRAQPVVTSTSDLTAPVAPASSVKLGCYYFPVMLDWEHSGSGMRHVDYLKPLLGYYDEASPQVADWHIKGAVEAGIQWFAFDWYWNQGYAYLNDALEQGFLKSRFADQMEWCVHWCNEGHGQGFKPISYKDDSLEGFIRYLCEHYFSLSNYLKVDGKPVVMIYQPWRLADARGGWEGCAEGLALMRRLAEGYGLPGVYFIGVQNHPILTQLGLGGFDATTSYNYGRASLSPDPESNSLPFEALLPLHRENFAEAQRRAHEQDLAYIPTGWVGWDDIGRAGERAWRTRGNTPAAFRASLSSLPDFVEPDTKLALFEAWNEWGEGGSVEPGLPYGFGYLEAIRDVLTEARGAPWAPPMPDKASVARLEATLDLAAINEQYERRYAEQLGLPEKGLRMDFRRPDSLWLRPWGQVEESRIEEDALRGRASGGDPVLIGPPYLGFEARRYKKVVFTLSVTAGKHGQVFWQREEDTDWAGERGVDFELNADGRPHEYTVYLSGNPLWEGRIKTLRFDPMDAPGEFALYQFETVSVAEEGPE